MVMVFYHIVLGPFYHVFKGSQVVATKHTPCINKPDWFGILITAFSPQINSMLYNNYEICSQSSSILVLVISSDPASYCPALTYLPRPV